MKAEPQPNYDVNRASGTGSDNGCWLRRLVRRLVKICWTDLGHMSVSLDVQETKDGQSQNADNESNNTKPETKSLIPMGCSSSNTSTTGKLQGNRMMNRNLGESPDDAADAGNGTSNPCGLDKPDSLRVTTNDRITKRDRKSQKADGNVDHSIAELIQCLIAKVLLFAGWVFKTHKRVVKPSNVEASEPGTMTHDNPKPEAANPRRSPGSLR